MTRSEADVWDIVSSVGVTALAVAALRAMESSRADALVHDHYAAHFVAAVRHRLPSLYHVLADPDVGADPGLSFLVDLFAARTKYFDDYFMATGKSGVRQAVVMAAGLDVRAHRLSWPADTVVFEIDQPKVLDFKQHVLSELNAVSTCDRRATPVDLRDDWPAALEAAGFRRSLPTAWSLEGLLPYLPGAVQDSLFERMVALSAPGSCIAVDGPGVMAHEGVRRYFKEMSVRSEAVQRLLTGVGDSGLASFWFENERRDPTLWLAEQGWTIDISNPIEFLEEHGRVLLQGTEQVGEVFRKGASFFTASASAGEPHRNHK